MSLLLIVGVILLILWILGFFVWNLRLSTLHRACYRSDFHHHLAAEKSVQTLLAVPDC